MKEADVENLDTNKNNEEPPKRLKGKIIKLETEGGWGFISSFDKKFTRIYFHWQALNPKIDFLSLKKGDFLTFECIRYIDAKTGEDKGWRAIRIELANE